MGQSWKRSVKIPFNFNQFSLSSSVDSFVTLWFSVLCLCACCNMASNAASKKFSSDKRMSLESFDVNKCFRLTLSTQNLGTSLETPPEAAWQYLLPSWNLMKYYVLWNLWVQIDHHSLLLIRISLSFLFGRLSAWSQNFVDVCAVHHLQNRDSVVPILTSIASSAK